MPAKKKTVTKLDSSYVDQYDAYIERQKRKKQRLIRRLVLFATVVVVVIGSMATYHFKQISLHEKKEEQYNQMEEKLATLKKEEENLRQEIKLLNNEEYVLEIARTNYFLSKEGELIFKIPDEEPSY
ncbi:septum formation initiator family protein [Virgibacillus sp. JSM 102003]|uniref:FtsB family cell division protein n=1 Tax=Virgibacillus sp. JSM 102003 TaxID=1562108 RepID=UPI0035C23857